MQSTKPKTTSHPLAGRWRGVYKAVPTEIRLRPEAHWEAWKDGDNKKSVGGGELELRVAPDGSVRGQATGALGKLRIVGSAEGDTVRLGVEPASPGAASTMRGYAIVQRSGQRLRGQLRVSDARGLHPRAATFILKR